MKRVMVLLVALLVVVSAGAWQRNIDNAVVLLAMQHLTPQVKERVEQIAKGDVKSQTHYLHAARKSGEFVAPRGWHTLYLDGALNPVMTTENNVVTQIESAVESLRHYASNSDSLNLFSLRVLFHLVPDMHNVGNVRIEGVVHSNMNFPFVITSGKEGTKRERRTDQNWRRFWHRHYCTMHSGFSSEFYAEDLSVARGSQREAMQQGTVRDWAHDVGVSCLPLYEWAKPDYVMCNRQRLELEEFHYTLVAKAAYRLAALLNDALE